MDKYELIAQRLKDADAILITASNGLSITEGLNLFANNEKFNNLFGDFKKKYGFRNILDGCFYRYGNQEEKWAWWSRLINSYNSDYTGSPVMSSIKSITNNKPYFILTSNGEAHFESAGFSSDCIYEIEGSWEHIQCSSACHGTLYPAKDMIADMAKKENDGKIPSELVPYCPKCNAPMNVHIATDNNFIPNKQQQKRFNEFINKYHNKRLVVLELGIGAGNRMIKAPIMGLVQAEPNAFYITFNKGEVYIPQEIEHKSVGIDGLLSDIFDRLSKQ